MKWKSAITFLLLLSCVLILPACGEDHAPDVPDVPEDPEVTTLIYAQVSENGMDREAVDRFNRTHQDVQIEVRDYSKRSENGRHGVELLMTEIAAGEIPDIIELGTNGQTCQLPYRRLAEAGYLEDLWPYIENDSFLGGRDGVVEAPLKAAEVNGGLYTVFNAVWIHTLIGSADVVGDRTSWTMDDLMNSYASMPEGTALIDNDMPGALGDVLPSMKNYMLSSLLYGFADSFVDWETGQCSFDSPRFRVFLEFINNMPEGNDEWREDCATEIETWEELVTRKLTGQVMLEHTGFTKVKDVLYYDFLFGGRAAFVGYPVEDGSVGSYFEPLGLKLAISSSCRDKESAWSFIRRSVLQKEINKGYVFSGTPVLKRMYAADISSAKDEKYGTSIRGQSYELGKLSAEDEQRFTNFFNSISRCSLFLETDILGIVEEEAAAYFAGDRDLDRTVDLIQRRVMLYVNERI